MRTNEIVIIPKYTESIVGGSISWSDTSCRSDLIPAIVVDGWPDAESADARGQYEEVHASYEPDEWTCGRVTMEPFAGGVRSET